MANEATEICETIETYKYPCGCAAEVTSTDYGTHTSINGSYFETCPTHSPEPDDYGFIHSHNPNVFDYFKWSKYESFDEYIKAEFGVSEMPIITIADLFIDPQGTCYVIQRKDKV